VFTNITGNAVATIVVANWEHSLDRDRLDAELNAGYRPPPPAIALRPDAVPMADVVPMAGAA
jgi:aerobic C4-dicarboxylate transport protein